MDPHIHKDKSGTARGMTKIILADHNEVHLDIKLNFTIKEIYLPEIIKRLDTDIESYSITPGEVKEAH